MTELDVTVSHADGRTTRRTIQVSRIANLGMAAREQPPQEVRDRQVAGMNDAGVRTPGQLPFVVPKPHHLITTADTIQVNSTNTAGEAEFVLLVTPEDTYVGVGNDHKDRDLSATAMHRANSTCPSVVSEEVWRLEAVSDHWDDLQLRSWVERDGTLTEHQRASLEAFMRPEELLETVEERITAPLAGTAIWSGTVGSGDGGVDPFPSVVSGPFYAVQLYDPVDSRRLFTRYDVEKNDWIADVRLD